MRYVLFLSILYYSLYLNEKNAFMCYIFILISYNYNFFSIIMLNSSNNNNKTTIDKLPIDVSDNDLPSFLESTLENLEKAFDISISIHDRLGIITNNSGCHLLQKRKTHMHPYCLYKRFEKKVWNKNCVDHCKFYVNHVMRQTGHSGVITCWKGVKELTVPFIQEGLHVMTIYIGCFKGECDFLDNASPELCKMHANLPELDPVRQEILERIAYILGCAILRIVQNERGYQIDANGRKALIIQCVEQNVHRTDFSISVLAARLNLSPTRTSHLVKELFGESFKMMVIKTRITRAKVLLVSSDRTMQEISNTVGIPNIYYFSRLFKKLEGDPPGKYRIEQLNQT